MSRIVSEFGDRRVRVEYGSLGGNDVLHPNYCKDVSKLRDIASLHAFDLTADSSADECQLSGLFSSSTQRVLTTHNYCFFRPFSFHRRKAPQVKLKGLFKERRIAGIVHQNNLTGKGHDLFKFIHLRTDLVVLVFGNKAPEQY